MRVEIDIAMSTTNCLFDKDAYIVQDNLTFFDVLEKIDLNNKGFSVICRGEKVVGILTDGDVRRFLISGYTLKDKIVFQRDFHFVDYESDFETVSNKIRKYDLEFVLILKDGALFNIIHKNQFHVMMLEGVEFRTDVDYRPFDRSLIHEIYNRPWGFYKVVFLSAHAQAKIITIFPGSETSLQLHKRREEYWLVIKGFGEFIRNEKRVPITTGGYIHIPKECKHQIINSSVEDSLILSEVQLGDYFGEDDIVRFKDKYGRC